METHMFWAYGNFSRLEYSCAKSFIKNDYKLNIWTYDENFDLIEGAVIGNARDIIDEEYIFLNSRGSYAGFSDLFRYEVLDKIGGLYVDTDVFALKNASELPRKNFIVSERVATGGLKINGNVIYNPIPEKGNIINLAKNYAKNFIGQHIQWGEIGPDLLTFIATSYSLHGFDILPPEFANPINWWECPTNLINNESIDLINQESYFIHFYNEMWRKAGQDKNNINDPSSLYEILLKGLY